MKRIFTCLAPALVMACSASPVPQGSLQAPSTDEPKVELTRTDAGIPQQNSNCDAPPTYMKAGPYVAGVKTIEIGGAPVEVWYPANPGSQGAQAKEVYDLRDWLSDDLAAKIPDTKSPLLPTDAYRDIPISKSAPFPIVLFSHGMGGFRTQSAFLMIHLATWGFVVAAPEHPERNIGTLLESGLPTGDNATQALRDARSFLETENIRAGSFFEGRIDATRVAVSGHSAGGAAVSAMGKDPGVNAWIGLATAGFGSGPQKPFLHMGGTADEIATPDVVQSSFDPQMADPKRLVMLENAGHLAFANICDIGKENGGLVQIAVDTGLEVPDLLITLATDGCRPTDRDPKEVWPVINHFVTGHIRWSMGFDPFANQIEQTMVSCFEPLISKFMAVGNSAVPPDPGQPRRDAGMPPAPVIDAGMCPVPDAGTTTPPADAGTTAPADSGTTPPPADAGTTAPPNPRAGIINCGNTTCDLSTDVCCVGLTAQTCTAASQGCTRWQATQNCDGPEDCSNGQVCCAGFPSGASCADSCVGNEQELCHVNADCNGADTCQLCSFPGSSANVCTTQC